VTNSSSVKGAAKLSLKVTAMGGRSGVANDWYFKPSVLVIHRVPATTSLPGSHVGIVLSRTQQLAWHQEQAPFCLSIDCADMMSGGAAQAVLSGCSALQHLAFEKNTSRGMHACWSEVSANRCRIFANFVQDAYMKQRLLPPYCRAAAADSCTSRAKSAQLAAR
jgi:hypothetical protein